MLQIGATSLLIFQAVLSYSYAMNIQDPEINLDFFIRATGSNNQSQSSVNCINGSIFARVQGQTLRKVFHFEGYNIGRKVHQEDGSYLLLSREFMVYRDPITREILKTWTNCYTQNLNEVFPVANDPVNGHLKLGNIFPSVMIPGGQIVFNSDIFLEYPNELNPSVYPSYSAGPVYYAAELFSYISDFNRLASSKEASVPMIGTWLRKSEFLPWMEMGASPGNLFYTTMFYKSSNGLSRISDDIMDLVTEMFPAYKEAPSTLEVPNETSWTFFKKIVDSRRKKGLPDTNIPKATIPEETPINATRYPAKVDDKILSILLTWSNLKVNFSGTTWIETPKQHAINLFSFEGTATINIALPVTGQPYYTVMVQSSCTYKNLKTGQPLEFWINPLNGRTVFIPKEMKTFTLSFPTDFVYSIDMPNSKAFGLIAVSSNSETNNYGREVWEVNMASLIFNYTELERGERDAMFYGTWGYFSSWPTWMKMDDSTEANFVAKATFYSTF